MTFTLDAARRRSLQTTTTDSSTTTVARHYSDDSDNPAWSQSVTGDASSITRYAESVGGDLDVSIDSTGTKVAWGNLHGDTVTTVTVPNGQTSATAATAIDGWSDYTEYGTPRDLATTNTIGGPLGYGWLGQKQRSTTDATAGLTLMGARLYNPTRGLFTTVDPIDGGSDSAYAYPTDPINQADVTGLWWSWRKIRRKAWGAVKFFSWGGYYDAAKSARKGDWSGAWSQAGQTTFGSGMGEASKRWGRYGKHSKRSWRGTVAKGALRWGARAFALPVSVGATALDLVNRYRKHQASSRKGNWNRIPGRYQRYYRYRR